MVTHFSTLAQKIPWMEDPDQLQSMGSQRVGHDRATSLSLTAVTFTWVCGSCFREKQNKPSVLPWARRFPTQPSLHLSEPGSHYQTHFTDEKNKVQRGEVFCLRSHSLLYIQQSWDLNPGLLIDGASLVAQTVKNPSAVWENWVRPLGWKNPLEEGMATHSNILTWNIPMNRGAWQATVHGVPKSQT